MDKPNWSADSSKGEHADDPFKTAQSVRADFDRLIDVFDRRLASLLDANGEARAHLLEAKAAAERGRKLSQELIEVLRSPI
jgi:hypothetical protein